VVSNQRRRRAANRIRLGRRKEQQMRFMSHRPGPAAIRAQDAKHEIKHVLRRGRPSALILGLAAAAAAAIAVPASASASTGASRAGFSLVAGHVYV
jgi:hypothetical protein